MVICFLSLAFIFSFCHAHLAVGRQKAIVEGGTRMSVKMGRYPTGNGGALCSSRSSTAPLMSLDTSPRISNSTDTCSSLTGQKNKHTHHFSIRILMFSIFLRLLSFFSFWPTTVWTWYNYYSFLIYLSTNCKEITLPDVRIFACKPRNF